jgi:hypothetical protein
MFEALMLSEMVCCVLLATSALQVLSDIAPNPELDLGQRAWTAARFSMAEAKALGPLFKHLVYASRHGLRRAHRMQEDIRAEREVREALGPLGPLWSLWLRRRIMRSAELAELAHLVEQLENMGSVIARYRAGRAGLLDLELPLSCVRQR